MTGIDSITATYDGAGNLTSTNPSGQVKYSPTNQVDSITSGGATEFSAAYDTLDQTQPGSITETTNGTTVNHVFTRTALGISQTVDNGKPPPTPTTPSAP
ncbi:hypothetical protein [Amycolatopsis sp. DSM 110486]|uniref:hypothetical protein n=1 Tax=Amycolatopsis sp. DSM 110486 TaxID=2865832 RepID=UPI0021082EEC|nr:hypothetical protein [Amycolatopsis sp. DSM 110486]